MKKLILAVAFVTASVFTANAQADSDLVQIGLKGGVNLASITQDDESFDEANSRTSFNVGFVAEIPYTNRFSLQGEVLYSSQGAEIKNTVLGQETTSEYKLGYFQIPVLAKVYLIEGLNIYAGPQIGFQISETLEVDGEEVDIEDSGAPESEDIDFGVAAGAGYKFDNGFFLDARYNRGFSELFEDSDARNSVISLGVGFMF